MEAQPDPTDGSIPPRWHEIIESLRGTCKSLHDVFEDGEEDLENDAKFCELLDSELLVCNTCGWWAETHEVDDDGDCAQCQGEED